MKVHYYQISGRWAWEVIDSHGNAFCRSTLTYSRLSDAKRSFQRLDRLF